MPRVVACLDVRGARVVKGRAFVSLRDMGDPADLAAAYERQGADEIVFLDVSATPEERATVLDVARETARRIFVPLTIGGGIRDADDVGRALRAGADKVSLNSAAVRDPGTLTRAASRFGSQCVVASIDARRRDDTWSVFIDGGRRPTGLDAVAWARECERRGAGEILLTSIDRDGARSGYDLELTAAVSAAVGIPVVASGGAGRPADVVRVLRDAGADAALVAGVLHDGVTTIRKIKRELRDSGVTVRWTQ